MRAILVIHRYLAVAVGVVMTLWCLSGFVMMYQGYPWLEEHERLRGLEPLDWSRCCVVPQGRAADGPLPDARIEMLLGRPVLRLAPRFGAGAPSARVIDLTTGEPVSELSPEQVLEIAAQYGRGHGIATPPRLLGPIDVDQWTVQTARRHRPAYRLAFDDPAGTEIYVSGATGEVFQDTTARERFLSWLGAVPHWLYPTLLRQNGPLWTQVVTWTSILGTFLAATGLYLGIGRFRRPRNGGSISPFRGWWYWHHITGLVFGLLVLTWTFSGLLTMNPWGLLAGGGSGYGATIRGTATWGELERFLAAAPERLGGEPLKQLASAPFDGRLHVVAVTDAGERRRLDASAAPAPLDAAELERAVAALGVPVLEASLLTVEDSFYYGHKSEVDLPVHRIVLDDPERTRLYIDRTSGSVRPVGATGRLSRWIRVGLHDFDFAGLRVRPVWDVVVLTLLAGVTAVCVTGTWMAWRRVRLDFRRLRRAWLGRRSDAGLRPAPAIDPDLAASRANVRGEPLRGEF